MSASAATRSPRAHATPPFIHQAATSSGVAPRSRAIVSARMVLRSAASSSSAWISASTARPGAKNSGCSAKMRPSRASATRAASVASAAVPSKACHSAAKAAASRPLTLSGSMRSPYGASRARSSVSGCRTSRLRCASRRNALSASPRSVAIAIPRASSGSASAPRPLKIIHVLTLMPQRTRRPSSRSSSAITSGRSAANSSRSGARMPAVTRGARIAARRSSGAGSRRARVR